LQGDFHIVADSLGLNVCHYRMLLDRPPAKALGNSIGAFQDALSLTYESLKTGIPKLKRIFSPKSEEESELRVAYSYPGSFGVAFTIPNERLLFPEMRTTLDKAVETVFHLGKAADNKSIIADTARIIGRAPIVAVHAWAKANVKYGVGASIRWQKRESVSSEVLIQAPEFNELSNSLERTTETKEEDITLEGTLVGADAKSKTFHFLDLDTSDFIKGKFTNAISDEQQAKIPGRYKVHIHKTTVTSYAMDEEKVSYSLLRLEGL